ncbi:MAG: hypothetical protein NTY38_02390, partial [Acidobacteria bacterium]|nr:hypothetical protein [Acidobacteriota bacterium]
VFNGVPMALRAAHSDGDASVPAPGINNLRLVFNGAVGHKTDKVISLRVLSVTRGRRCSTLRPLPA